MKKRIQLKESDIKRMVMEALSELTAQNAFDASDLAGQRAKEAEDAGNFDLADRKRAQRNNFMRLGLDKEDNPDRPVVHAPKGFKWSQDAQNQEEPNNSEPSFDDDLNARKQLNKLLAQRKSIESRVYDWANSVKDKFAEMAFNNSQFADVDFDEMLLSNDDNYEDEELETNNSQMDIDYTDYSSLMTPEYWALWKTCITAAERGTGIFTDKELRQLAAQVYNELTRQDDVISKSEFEERVPEEERGEYTYVNNKGYMKFITPEQYHSLPDYEKSGWVPYRKSRGGKSLYRRIVPKRDGMGNVITARVYPEQISESLEDIIEYAFESQAILKYAPKIIPSRNPYKEFKTCLMYDAMHYLRKFKKDTFVQTEDSTMDGNGDEENGGGRVPEELMSNGLGSAGGDSSRAAIRALSTLKEKLEFVLNDDYNADINRFSSGVDKDTGKPNSNKTMAYALRYIIDNFNNIFNTKTIDTFSDLISKEKTTTNGSETVYNESSEQGMMFIKDVVATFIAKRYYDGYNNTPNNAHIERKRASKADANGNRPYEDRLFTTCGDANLDKILSLTFAKHDKKAKEDGRPNDVFIQVNGNKAVINRPYEDVFAKVKSLLEKMWTTLGQQEGTRWNFGDEITRRFKDYKRGALKPLNNPGAVNEKLIRKIVMETLRRHLRML